MIILVATGNESVLGILERAAADKNTADTGIILYVVTVASDVALAAG